jgi:penicillin-binding protein 2
MQSEAERNRTFGRRALLLGGLQAALATVLVGRMTYLSVFERDRFKLLAEDNRVSLRLLPPRRGQILDRFGRPIAENRDDYRLVLIPEQVQDAEALLAQLTRAYNLTEDDLARIRRDLKRNPKFVPVEIARNLNWDQFARLNVALPDLVGLQPQSVFIRSYPDGAAVSHLLGYVGAPGEKLLEEDKDPLLRFPGFKVGKGGIEKAFETSLRGKSGADRVEVNARGRVIRNLDRVEPVQGDNLVLTIDQELQAFAAQRLEGESGSALLMSVDTGEVLTYASVPGFDPNSFSAGIRTAEWRMLNEDERNPLINKPVAGLYTPGSTFKMIVALAALEAQMMQEDTRVYCSGRFRLGNHTFNCHKRGGHGVLDMGRAIAASCNVYFYTAGQRIGIDRIAAMARQFGLGERYDLPLPSQKRGVVPDPAWKMKRFNKAWLPGETLNTAIGQGYILATPLQLAVMSARLASGRAVVPKLVRQGREPEKAPLLNVSQEHLAFIRQSMSDVVNAGGGTARRARVNIEGMTIAGKTGTAQVRRISAEERRRGVIKNDALPWKLRDHAMFVGFAPVEAPRYACAVVVEHGGSGGAKAAPIASAILAKALERDPLAKPAFLTSAPLKIAKVAT